MVVLTSGDTSSLVVDELCDMAGERNIAVSCFYIDFAAQEEQSPTSILGSLLKQIVGGLERIPDEISQAFQKLQEGDWWEGTTVAGNCQNVADCHIFTTDIYMCRCS